MLGQLDTTMEENNTRKLKQLKLSPGEKLVLLAKLDEEIQCEIDDNSLESEIKAADEVRERINLALIMINKALDALTGQDPWTEASDISLPPLSQGTSETADSHPRAKDGTTPPTSPSTATVAPTTVFHTKRVEHLAAHLVRLRIFTTAGS